MRHFNGGTLLATSLLLLLCASLCSFSVRPLWPEDWGFFAHRRLNRLAVFTLDADMMPFFRDNLEYLTEHAVDPDKRRYATKHEAVRHYIDLDHWGSLPFANVPRRWTDALIYRANFQRITSVDTINWRVDTITHEDPENPFNYNSRVQWTNGSKKVETRLRDTRTFFNSQVIPRFYDDIRLIPQDSLGLHKFLLGAEAPAAPGGGKHAGAGPQAPGGEMIFEEGFTEYGIAPYNLLAYHYRLQRAFEAEDADAILRLAAEMGHYIGDAHVPLHTTENYNGQMTGQLGIHGFWESRLPELFADKEYDYFVGKAEYIATPREYYWDIVLDSHALVDSVLSTEARLRREYPGDRQQCYDTRLGREILVQCEEFSRAWSEAMDGMVEERFRASVRSIGSVWFTCWVDAGQPDLTKLAPSAAAYARRDTLVRNPDVRETRGRIHE